MKTPGQYNTSITEVMPKRNYTRYFDKELGVFLPIYNDDSEDSYYLKDHSNDIPEDPDYHVKYDESDESLFSNDDNGTSQGVEDGSQTDSNNDSNENGTSQGDVEGEHTVDNSTIDTPSNNSNDDVSGLDA